MQPDVAGNILSTDFNVEEPNEKKNCRQNASDDCFLAQGSASQNS
jgi:hypothetical protein